MEQTNQAGTESEVRLARKMVANILWRSSARGRRQVDGRSLASLEDIYMEFTTTYPDMNRPIFEMGLSELARQGKIELTCDNRILVDFTTLE